MDIRFTPRPAPLPKTGLLVLCLAVIFSTTVQAGVAQGMHDHPAAPLSDMLTLTVDGRSLHLSPAELAAMPQTTVTVHNAHTKQDEQYTGVALSDLLARADTAPAPNAEHRDPSPEHRDPNPEHRDPNQEQRLFHSYLRAQGTDNYFVLYSGTEIESGLHKGNVLVALRLNGQPLTTDGRFKLVSTEDTRPARWVRNLTLLDFITVN